MTGQQMEWYRTFPSHGCGMQQHLGLHPNVPDWRVSCHTVKFGRFMSYLYWQMNYHVERHMYAAVPFYNLKRLHRAMAFDTLEPLRGYVRGLRRILEIQKKQQVAPTYCFMPEFPETAAPPKMPT